jgi:hypothetical protein
MTPTFDPERAWLRGPDFFPRFIMPDHGEPLAETRLGSDVELVVVERGGECRALVTRELSHPHMAQGTLGGEPWLVSFWGVCNSGVGLTPVIDGREHHFSAGGLYDGLVLLIDDQSESYWNHITGEALHGPLKGHRLEAWPIDYTTVGAARDRPGLELVRVPIRSVTAFAMRWLHRRKIGTRGFVPLPFRKTMVRGDDRLPEMTQGVGVLLDKSARFYPVNRLATPVEDHLGNRALNVSLDPHSRVPRARWADGSLPMQLFTRWYGFSASFPGCEIY